jgi:RNA polymerase sigma-70 factor (ECF subfamily)
MEDKLIIEMLWQRSESALRELEIKYGKALHLISYNILKNHEDAEECVNDTYLGVWKTIPPEKQNSLYAFVCRITRNLSLKRYQYNKADKRNFKNAVNLEEISDFIAEEDFCAHEFKDSELTRILEDWLWSLTENNRYIFIRRYWYMDEIETIANALSVSNASVYLRIDRMKKKLKDYLKQREVFL